MSKIYYITKTKSKQCWRQDLPSNTRFQLPHGDSAVSEVFLQAIVDAARGLPSATVKELQEYLANQLGYTFNDEV